MLFAFTTLDYTLVGLYLAGMVAVGAHFSRQQHSAADFFLAGRSMSWFPVGLSIMATLISALSYTGVPSEAYRVGLVLLLWPAALWLTLPVVYWIVLPIYSNLRMFSIYEYLELRYDRLTRTVGTLMFILWRLLWLGGVLYAPCKVLVIAAGVDVSVPVLLVLLGIISTGYTFLGGIKAVIWTDVVQTIVMLLGLALIILGIWFHLDGGAARVWETARQLERTQILHASWPETSSFWSENWLIWTVIPHLVLANLSFLVADQITAQRFLTTNGLGQARRSFLLNCVSVSITYPALIYVGIALLAYYQDYPEQMRPFWIVSAQQESPGDFAVDPRTGHPMIDRHTDIAADFDHLVAVKAILDPATEEPFSETKGLFDTAGHLNVERLARVESRTKETLVLRGWDEIMPQFIAQVLPAGCAGLIFAALLAASMSSIDSGLNSISTLAIVELYRRQPWWMEGWARMRGKSYDHLNPSDELWLGRWLVLLIGVMATVFGLFVAQLGNIFTIMVAVVNTFGGPLLGIFLLGMTCRRATAPAAISALILGTLLTVWLAFGSDLGWWPWSVRLNHMWPLTLGLVGTLSIGYLLSFFMGHPRSKQELAGLVIGLGKLGVRDEQQSA